MFPVMRPLVLFISFLAVAVSSAQDQNESADAGVRVSVVINPDGSRTSYEFNTSNKTAVATTTGTDGKLREKIRYVLDDAGRYARGRVFGPGGKLLFFTAYKYDAAGRLAEESHTTKDGNLIGKLIFRYDAAGRQIGYSAFDGSGHLLGQTSAAAAGSPKARRQ